MPVGVDTYPVFACIPNVSKRRRSHRAQAADPLLAKTNPTGITLTRGELEAAAAIAKKHNLLVISDEIYDAFCYQKHESIAPLLPEQCILLKGYSKTYGMTGWRLGYVGDCCNRPRQSGARTNDQAAAIHVRLRAQHGAVCGAGSGDHRSRGHVAIY